MASPFHNLSTTSIPLVEDMSSFLPIHEDNSLSMNLHSLYPFPAHQWVPFDPTLVWPHLPAQFDPRLLTRPPANNPLATYGTPSIHYLHAKGLSSMVNLGYAGTQGPCLEGASAAPIAVNNSTGHITEAIVDKHAILQEQTAYEGQKMKMTKHHSSLSRPETFMCKWEGCMYNGTFGVESSLWRHIQSTHLAPNSLQCPAPRCKKAFGRRDKYNAHIRLVHRDMADLIDNLGHSPCDE